MIPSYIFFVAVPFWGYSHSKEHQIPKGKHFVTEAFLQTLPSLLHARPHSASPFQKICYPFPRCMQVQRIPDELSSPCCEMREKNLSPGDQNLSPSPPGLFAAQRCQSNGFYERQTAIPGLWLTSCCGSSPPGKGRKPKSKPSAGADFPLLCSPVH